MILQREFMDLEETYQPLQEYRKIWPARSDDLLQRERSSLDVVFLGVYFWSDGPMIRRWHEFSCSYLWNGMLTGQTWRLKHHRNGGWRSQRWGNSHTDGSRPDCFSHRQKKENQTCFFLSAQTLNTVFYLDIEAVLCVNVLILSSGYDLHGVHTFYKSLVEVEIII